MKRASGILMHISSLPGQFGIGTFGRDAYRFIDFLAKSGQSYWQILPLMTTSYGDSPYQSFSAVAGNTNFIDFDCLAEAGWLERETYQNLVFSDDEEQVDYARLFELRRPILEQAVSNFLKDEGNQHLLEQFVEENRSWLPDYAEFMAIKEYFGHKALQKWEDSAILQHQASALVEYRRKLVDKITYYQVTQYFFFSQWQDLKTYANKAGISIIGDMPIYVSADSVEVWTQPELFKLDTSRNPIYVAGCPADDFSEDGQLWGNPIYDWDYHRSTNFAWWVYRIQESFKLYDYLRIDHFKGFSDYWQIAADSESAAIGSWQPGPGYDLFKAVKDSLGELPIIAEDLGYIDDKARQLLADCGYPGMKVLEFGFYDVSGRSIDIAHRCVPNSVAYLGTHDNEVINGWYDNLTKEQQTFVNDYTNRQAGQAVNEVMLKLLFSTVSQTVIASMQDVLDKGAASRMNLPSTVGGNWQWRMKWSDLTEDKIEFLKKITVLYERRRETND